MKKIRTDYTIKKNAHSERQQAQPDLWNVMLAKSFCVTIVTGKQAAQELANNLNKDPWYLDWNKTYPISY